MEDKPKVDKKTLGIIGVIILLFFVGTIAINEYTLMTGEEVFLETIPVDPRDLLRGDYVILDYKIAQDEKVSTFIKDNNLKAGNDFYIALSVGSDSVATVKSVSINEPEGGLFIKAEVGTESWRRTNVELGVGKYFVPEGKGRQLEVLRGDLEVLVTIDRFGTAKIVDMYYDGEKFEFE